MSSKFLALIAALCAALVPPLAARPPYVNRIPNGRVNACANCHINPMGGGMRNQFGMAIARGRINEWSAAIARLDSDGDGVTNGQELQDPGGVWRQGNADPGDPRLISSPGFTFSTPGERSIFILGVIANPTEGPEGEQLIGLFNSLDAPVDASGLILYSGERTWAIPQGVPQAVIPPRGFVNIVIDGTRDPSEPGSINEPAGSGLGRLNPQADFVSLHWTGGPEHFTRPTTLMDYVQWGRAGQPLEGPAVQGRQWQTGLFAPSPPPGAMLRHDGRGEGASHWQVMGGPAAESN